MSNVQITYPGGGPDVTRRNKLDTIYVKGDADTDGSIRIVFVAGDANAKFELRTGDAGTPGDAGFDLDGLTLASSSLRLGLDMIISAVAGYIETTNPTEIVGHGKALIPHITFDESGAGEPHIPVAGALEFIPLFVNKTGENFSTLHGQVYEFVPAAILDFFTFETGSTAPTKFVQIKIFIGTDNTGFKISDIKIAASQFAANSPINIDYKEDLGFETAQAIFVQLESSVAFSMDIDAGGNLISSVTAHELRELEFLALNMIMKNDAGQVITNDGNFVLKDYFKAAPPSLDFP